MNRTISSALAKVEDIRAEVGARAMLASVNLYNSAVDCTGRMMTTRAGKAMLALPAICQACALTVSAEGTDADSFISAILGVLGPGIIALGSLVAVVGGVQLGVSFKDDNPDGKTRGFQTLVGGAIISAVGAIVPTSLSIGGGS